MARVDGLCLLNYRGNGVCLLHPNCVDSLQPIDLRETVRYRAVSVIEVIAVVEKDDRHQLHCRRDTNLANVIEDMVSGS